LLIGWLREASAYQSMTLMFQKEVADRIVSPPGNKAYGRLSVMSQWLCDVRHEFTVDRRAFTPPPSVTSSVVSFVPKNMEFSPDQWEAMERVAKTLFGQRRKMLRSTIKPLGLNAEALGLDPESRAETLSIEDFCLIAAALAPKG
ncbi:MAG: 16S rRNA (adenine(1518)-N(6)/adenine(1519)-N(6))-dimethyltransferase, partial [Proteobacteria bacterium]|nr:16S rRNA (adenine(1518)-N(6)/adenine(1519)-N(6))-dimethyltransferase [Pseudomonadota bacterium]